MGQVDFENFFQPCCSCTGSSCRSVVLDDAEVSMLDRYKLFISCVVVAGGVVLSVCVCKDSSACWIVMTLYGFPERNHGKGHPLFSKRDHSMDHPLFTEITIRIIPLFA